MKKKSNICFNYEPELLLVFMNENCTSFHFNEKKEQKMKK